jgi:hypothetical protein
MISQYWIGQRPIKPMLINVTDLDGKAIDLSNYSGYELKILDPDNYEIDASDFTIHTSEFNLGRVTITFPAIRSIFEKTGAYIMRLEFSNANGLDFTNTYTMNVTEFGGDDVYDLLGVKL